MISGSMGSQIHLPVTRLMVKNSEIKYAPQSARDTQLVDVEFAGINAGNERRTLVVQLPASCLSGYNPQQFSAYCTLMIRAGNRCKAIHSVKRNGSAYYIEDVVDFTVSPSQVQASIMTDLAGFSRTLFRQETALWNMMSGYAKFPSKAEKYLNAYMREKIGAMFEELRSGRGSLMNPVLQTNSAANTVSLMTDRVIMDSRGATLVLPGNLNENSLAFRIYSNQLLSEPRAGEAIVSVQHNLPFVIGIFTPEGFTEGFVITMEVLRLVLDDYMSRLKNGEKYPAEHLMRDIDSLLENRLYRRSEKTQLVGINAPTAGLWSGHPVFTSRHMK